MYIGKELYVNGELEPAGGNAPEATVPDLVTRPPVPPNEHETCVEASASLGLPCHLTSNRTMGNARGSLWSMCVMRCEQHGESRTNKIKHTAASSDSWKRIV